MNSLKILDCTLRDGGFVNEWEFGKSTIVNIYDRLDCAGINIIELGYLRDYVTYNENNTQFSCVKDIDNIIKHKPVKAEMLVSIIDFGCCSLDRICPRSESVIDGIRVTFKKNQLDEAAEFCKQIAEKGYNVFMQPVSITDYSDKDVIRLVEKANEVHPYALYIVDTYGFMHKHDLMRYWLLMNSTLAEDVCIGYHAHNNFQLAYSNAIELMEINTNRTVIIDSSAFGMGKGAGNANTELIALYLNENFSHNYDISQILEIIDTYIEKEREQHYWGYSLLYYLAASNDCHHNYVRYLIKKKTLSVKSINELLSLISPERKTKFDQDYIEELYQEYQNRNSSSAADLEALRSVLSGKVVLAVGPGKSVGEQREEIDRFILQNKPVTVSVNHISPIGKTDYIFISNVKRYEQVSAETNGDPIGSKVILTSNITPAQLCADHIVDFSQLVTNDNGMNYDNSMLMLIKLLCQMNVKSIALAGFDGYQQGSGNYYKSDLEFSNSNYSDNCDEKNRSVAEMLSQLRQHIEIEFITESKYNKY